MPEARRTQTRRDNPDYRDSARVFLHRADIFLGRFDAATDQLGAGALLVVRRLVRVGVAVADHLLDLPAFSLRPPIVAQGAGGTSGRGSYTGYSSRGDVRHGSSFPGVVYREANNVSNITARAIGQSHTL